MVGLIQLLLGILLLVIGRRFYWFFISSIGFIAGVSIAYYFVHTTSFILEIIIAIVAGIIGILLANLVQRVAIMAAGTIAGGYTFIGLLNIFHIQLGWPQWLPFIIGAIIGLILMTIIFDWALIIITSSIGALLVIQNVPIPNHFIVGAYILLFIVGVVLQFPYKKKRS